MQGSLLSPLLYSVFMEDLITSLNDNSLVPADGGRPFRCLLYADDIVLIASRPDVLRKMLRVCEHHSPVNRYQFNIRFLLQNKSAKMYQRINLLLPK